ncbi:DUF4191 domain-containing protein [Sciscionella sediminilitoris]|uniref:DUF4191 domain-containing protein n=1 Tax=Sciscionella sediminilitoris TaxID=1445613 RepID=UPI0004DF3443|nr:DUF4191 domain-containing protein [Sciscionella sp. SE31]
MAGKEKASAQEKQAQRAERKQKRGQFFEAFKMQLREDKGLIPWLLGTFIVIAAVVFAIGWLIGQPWILLPLGVVLGVLGAVIVFGRRVQRNVYAKADGQPGAAAWALDQLRGGWRVKQAVAGTTQLDALHRVVGRPGVILVAEGAPHRVKSLISQEKKRISRVIGQTPIYEVIIGDEEGQVKLSKLQRHLMRLPRNITTNQVDEIEKRVTALGTKGAAMPKGPTPQGAKMRNVQRTIRRR